MILAGSLNCRNHCSRSPYQSAAIPTSITQHRIPKSPNLQIQSPTSPSPPPPPQNPKIKPLTFKSTNPSSTSLTNLLPLSLRCQTSLMAPRSRNCCCCGTSTLVGFCGGLDMRGVDGRRWANDMGGEWEREWSGFWCRGDGGS